MTFTISTTLPAVHLFIFYDSSFLKL